MSEVTVRAIGTALEFRAIMGTEPPTVEGYAQWRTQPRPLLKPLTVYEGQNPLVLTLPLLFDGFALEQSVEPFIDIVERMAVPAAENQDPPSVQVLGPVPHSGETWVITGIAWGDAEYTRSRRRSRQYFTLTLTEFIRADRVVSPARRKRARTAPANRRGRMRRYTVRPGDTLTKIAARVLGDHRRWKEISVANNIKDPSVVLKTGSVILLP